MSAGQRHIKPVSYNCPCNLGRRTWLECVGCESRRYAATRDNDDDTASTVFATFLLAVAIVALIAVVVP